MAWASRPWLGFGHFTKTFVSQHVVWIHSFEPMMRNCMQRNKIAELVLGAPRETAERANPQRRVALGSGVWPFLVARAARP